MKGETGEKSGLDLMRILIIDDEQYVRLVMEQALREEGCEVASADNGQAGIELLQSGAFDCVITDLRMPGTDGKGVLKWVRAHQPDVDVILLTGHGDVKDAVDAMKQGAWDFLIKETPFDGTVVTAALTKLRTIRDLRRENLAARRGGYRRDAIVEGPSLAWRQLKSQIARVAVSDASVLIQGETGTGKEIVARLLHDLSPRACEPFLAVNCGAVSRELLESELFGHEKGAFTGAAGTTPGLVAAADRGTLFLDEIAEMPASMQVTLLRFLDRGEYRPVGSTRTLYADVRVLGATNQDIQQLVSRGRFREDLLYRINTVTLQVPPLRERQDDLPVLIDHFLRSSRLPGIQSPTLTHGAVTRLQAYPWPGNVRELRNVTERLALIAGGNHALCEADVVDVLPTSSRRLTDDPSRRSLDEVERLHIQRVLEANSGNKTQAAKILAIDYKTLLSKLKKYDIGGS